MILNYIKLRVTKRPVPQVIIAKIATAKIVNGGEVRARERVEAEKFYIRHCMETSGKPSSAIVAEGDATFAACLEKHGEPVAKKVAAVGGIGGGLIQVTLKSMAPESSHIAPVSRKLPGSMTVRHHAPQHVRDQRCLTLARTDYFAKCLSSRQPYALAVACDVPESSFSV